MSAPSPDLVLRSERVFDGKRMRSGQAIVIARDRVIDVTQEPPPCPRIIRLPPGSLVAPGFIDVQVNGGGGVLLNDDPSLDAIRRIAAAHRRVGGTTALLPTLISDTRDAIRAAVAGVRAAIAQGVPGVLGLHLEGPFLNPARKGIHDPARLAPFEPGDADLIASLGEAGLTLVTLAPEQVPPEAVADLVRRGVRVAAGHTDDPGEAIRAAVDAGLTGVTHLFNAMSQLGPRAPGAVGVALTDPRVFAGLIADGHHVGPASLKIALRMMGCERLMLVTDAMPPVGDPADRACFPLFGRTIRRDADRLTGPDGTLAGAALTMAGAVRHMVRTAGASLEEALAMASLTPARFLGLDGERGHIAPGYRADLVLLDRDLAVLGTCLGGDLDLAAA